MLANDVMIAADSSEESKTTNQKEGVPAAEEDTMEQLYRRLCYIYLYWKMRAW